MKRILIIDESEVIRETLALILGRDYIVSKRTLGDKQFRLADAHQECDLLIIGVAPQLGWEAVSLARFSAQLPCAVLFLVDSKSAARDLSESSEIACLPKPFNPYELHARVGQLLARQRNVSRPIISAGEAASRLHRYLEFPYVSRSVASVVQRFAQTGLSILISGELGCGQENVARAIQTLQPDASIGVSFNVAEMSAEQLRRTSTELARCRQLDASAPILLIHNLDQCHTTDQSSLLRFLEEQDERDVPVRCLTTATGDLLERVYGNRFLAPLYYRLAMLTLKLPSLRERSEDIPLIAEWFARSHASALRLVTPTLSTEAQERLKNYFWFGNLNELETVVVRTLALSGGGAIDADDLVFDFGGDPLVGVKPFEMARSASAPTNSLAQPKLAVYNASSRANGSVDIESTPIELSVVIHELAHELKNPMVTIKTFAQLLGDRYQDENFRARFQEIVGDDIERMDDLLEVMIEFADFAEPKPQSVALGEKLLSIARDIQTEAAKRQTRFEWKRHSPEQEIRSDESQLTFILRNVMLAVLSQAKLGSEITIDMARRGAITIAYLRESARVASITRYLKETAAQTNGGTLPLRILLAQQLVERNGGRFSIDQSAPDQDIFRLEFPIG
jgi:DNA-binding NtrC family response regulator